MGLQAELIGKEVEARKCRYGSDNSAVCAENICTPGRPHGVFTLIEAYPGHGRNDLGDKPSPHETSY